MPSSSNFAGSTPEIATQPVGRALDAAMSTGMAWLEMMMRLQQASLQSFSSYSPISDVRISGSLPQRSNSAGLAVVPVGEERLNIATRTVPGETTRIRRRVVAQPVEQEVTLREEQVVVERRRPQQNGEATNGAPPRQDVLTETVIEMSDSRQVPTVWKSVHVAEEVVLRKQVTERREKVRETVRRDVVEVEHDREAGARSAAVEHEGGGGTTPRLRQGDAEAAARQRTEALAEAARQTTVPHGEPNGPEAPGEARRGPGDEGGAQHDRNKPGTQGGPQGSGRRG